MKPTSNLLFMLSRRGQPATLEVTSDAVYDPTTGAYTETSESLSIKAYFSEYHLGEGPVGEVAKGTRWVLVPPVDTVGDTLPRPNTKDRIVGVQDTLTVKSVQTIYNGSDVVCYICESVE